MRPALLVFLVIAGSGYAHEKKPHDLGRAAIDRQARYESIRVKMKVDEEKFVDPQPPVGISRIELTFEETLTLQERNVRYDGNAASYTPQTGRIVQASLLSISTPQSSKSTTRLFRGDEYPETQETSDSSSRGSLFATLQLFPLMFFARAPADERDWLSAADLIPTGRVESIDGRPCQE